MSVAKCHNVTGCLLAYRGEAINLPANAPLVCPECGKPLTVSNSLGSPVRNLLIAVVALGLLGAAVWFGRPIVSRYMGSSSHPAETPPSTTDGPATPVPVAGNNGAKPATPPVKGSVPTATPEPVAAISRPARIDLDLKKSENKQAQDEVLKRIDLMPNVSQANRDKLYVSVHRARSMGIVLTIPFGAAKVSLSPSELQQLKVELEKPEIATLREDPTAVFVVLGYADPKGDEKKNLEISQKRADGVLDAMRDKCGVANVMHAVAMGGQKLLDARSLEKNRVVEVWVVLP